MDDVGKRYWELDESERRVLVAATAVSGSRPVDDLEQALETVGKPANEKNRRADTAA